MLRAGKKAVVSFPNFAYWKVRFYLFFNGKMPKSNILPFEWYNTPNIHLLTIKDFFEFCKKRNIKILKEVYMNKARLINNIGTKWHKNLFTEEALFCNFKININIYSKSLILLDKTLKKTIYFIYSKAEIVI